MRRGALLSVRWLVDGMNVVGSRPDGWWRDRDGAVRALCGQLAAFAERGGESVTVVFDGRPVELPEEAAGRIEVAFAERAGPNAADDEIVQRVEVADQPGGMRVVTSDAQLAERVRAAGAAVEGAGAFRRRLDEASGG